ncbi:MAG: MFS transporter, partial [Clostridia bacterium]|nr:MFS transporter [Clostridia bacterium]
METVIETALTDKRENGLYYKFIFAAYFLYMISIATKMCYTAEMVSMMGDFSVSKAEISKGLTVYYFIYAVGQFSASFIMKRINMKWFMICSILISAASFLFVPFVDELYYMWIILGLNGLCHAGIYGGCMHFFALHLPERLSPFAAKVTSTGVTVGTALAYGVSAFFVAVTSWRDTFVFFSFVSVLSVILFAYYEKKIESAGGEKDRKEGSPSERTAAGREQKRRVKTIIAYLLCSSILLSVIYYGISFWVPNLMKEVHNMPDAYSILITLFVPLIAMPGPIVSVSLCKRRKNYFSICALFVFLSLAVISALFFLYGANIILAFLLSSLSLFFIRGTLNLVSPYIPLLLKKECDTGKLSYL